MSDAFDYESAGRPTRYVKPHRGAMILVLGILGLVVCGFLGIPAWIMGSNDLTAMRFGMMDRSGEGLTRAGQVLGMIGTVLTGLGFCFVVIALLLG